MFLLRWLIGGLGLVLILLGGLLLVERQKSSPIYFLLGEQYFADACCTTYTSVYLPDGTLLTRVEGSSYDGDFPYYDLYWGMDGLHFYNHSMYDYSVSRVSLDGQIRVPLGKTSASLSFAHSYSPDNQALVWLPESDIDYAPFGTNQLWFMDLHGQHQRTLEIPPYISAMTSAPVWSPDGKWLYLRVCHDLSDNLCNLFRVQPDGSNWQHLIEGLDPGHLMLQWSLDGKILAMVNRDLLWFMPAEGYETYYSPAVSMLPDGEGTYPTFFWSDNSQRIIFAPDEHSIVAVSVDTEEQQPLVANETYALRLLPYTYQGWIYYLVMEPADGDTVPTADLYRFELASGNSELVHAQILKNPQSWIQTDPILSDSGWLLMLIPEGDDLNLYRMRPDGTEKQRLWIGVKLVVDGYANYSSFMLAPNGRHVLIGDKIENSVSDIISLDGEQIYKRTYDYSPNAVYNTLFFHPSPLVNFPGNLWLVIGVGIGLLLTTVILSILQMRLLNLPKFNTRIM